MKLSNNSSRPRRGFDFARSGILTILALAVILGIVFAVWWQKRRGGLQQLTAISIFIPAGPPRPGTQEMVSIERAAVLNGAAPEFTSALLFPGVGMEINQIKASIPMHGETPLFVSLQPESFQEIMARPSDDPAARASNLANLAGAPFLVYTVDHHGAAQQDFADPTRQALILAGSGTRENHTMPDGGDSTAFFQSSNDAVPGGLPAHVEVRASFLMSSRSLDISLTARNTGTTPLPLRIGWMPHFAIPSGDRQNVSIILPQSNHTGPLPSGVSDGASSGGAHLGSAGVDFTLAGLRRDFLSNGPEVELRDPASQYAVKMTLLEPGIDRVRVIAPAGANWVSILPISEPTSDDEKSAGMLAPGGTLRWRVRLELRQLLQQ